MAKHLVMDPSGHSTVEFDQSNTVELGEALARWTALTSTGHTAAVRKSGETDYTLTRSFDPPADETLFVPQLKGG